MGAAGGTAPVHGITNASATAPAARLWRLHGRPRRARQQPGSRGAAPPPAARTAPPAAVLAELLAISTRTRQTTAVRSSTTAGRGRSTRRSTPTPTASWQGSRGPPGAYRLEHKSAAICMRPRSRPVPPASLHWAYTATPGGDHLHCGAEGGRCRAAGFEPLNPFWPSGDPLPSKAASLRGRPVSPLYCVLPPRRSKRPGARGPAQNRP